MAVALVVAAGRGERLGTAGPKALVDLAGRPMLEWSLDALCGSPGIERIVVALPEGVALEGAMPAGHGRRRRRSGTFALGAQRAGRGRAGAGGCRPRRRSPAADGRAGP